MGCFRRRRCRLLGRVGELMGEQRAAVRHVERAKGTVDDNVAPKREAFGAEFARGLATKRIGVNPNGGEVSSETRLHLATFALGQRRAGRRKRSLDHAKSRRPSWRKRSQPFARTHPRLGGRGGLLGARGAGETGRGHLN
jgi:hypothetical protein